MKHKNDTFSQAIVGLFMVTILLLLGYFTIVISGVDLLAGREKVQLSVLFSQVGGLKEHDNVMYRGTKVGTVDRIKVTSSNLVVFASVNADVILRDEYRITVCNLSMLGGNYLSLEEGAGERLELATTKFRGETPTDWMSDFMRIARNLRDLTERIEVAGIVTNLEAASEAAKVVAQRVERGEGLVGKLTSDQDNVYGEIKEVISNVKQVSSQLNRQRLYDDLELTVADFRTMCSNVTAASAGIAKAVDGIELGKSVDSTNEFLAKAKALADNLNAVATRLREGEGTLGKLTSDGKMYDEVNGLIRDCRQIIDNYRDTTPISTFTSLATGAL